MQIETNEKMKLVSIWLTREECIDKKLRDELKPLFPQYKEKKYKVAVFESGDKNLFGLTVKDNKYKLYKYDKEDYKESDDKAVGF